MTRGQNEDRKNELPGCPGFSPGLPPYFFDAHQWSRSPSHSAACVSLINSEDPKDQAAAKAGNMVALTGRLKPPSSTIVPVFFRKHFQSCHQKQKEMGFQPLRTLVPRAPALRICERYNFFDFEMR